MKYEVKCEWKAIVHPGSSIAIEVVFGPDDRGGRCAWSPNVPGALSQGDTLDDARANIEEALIALADEYGWVMPYKQTAESYDWKTWVILTRR